MQRSGEIMTNEEMEKLIEQELAQWADRLDVEMPEALRLRTRATTQHALSEAWLDDQPQPTPSAETLDRVRAAVTDELSRSSPRRGWRLRFAWPAAAAAMILLAISLYGPWKQNPSSTPDQGPQIAETTEEEPIERFVSAYDEFQEESGLTSDIASDIDSLESTLSSWDQEGTSDTTELADIMNDIDAILSDSQPDQETSGVPVGQERVFG